MTLVTDGHILVDENGEAWIDSTNVKVIEVVLDKLSHGSTAEEMHIQLPLPHCQGGRMFGFMD
ncbi:MAG TPA: hypothetical protein VFE47_01425 [Tepidisphaeraceae bacterium]|jgi:hypothetical protein|nr:hypothetical protein [Tepidisphaeraceae bacterium]